MPLGTEGHVGDGWLLRIVNFTADADSAVAAAKSSNRAPPAGQRYIVVAAQLRYVGTDAAAGRDPGFVMIRVVSPDGPSHSTSEAGATPPPADRTNVSDSTFVGNLVYLVPIADAAHVTVFASADFGQTETYFATT